MKFLLIKNDLNYEHAKRLQKKINLKTYVYQDF